MPNWCSCDLRVVGKPKEVSKFLKFAKGINGILDANNFIPYPKKYKDLDIECRKIDDERDKEIEKINKMKISEKKKTALIEEVWVKYPYIKDGYNSGGYEWCIANWGSKWNFSEVYIDEKDTYKGEMTLKIGFDSAWSPLDKVVIAMGKKFKKLDFELRYFEGGVGYNGLLRVEGGKVVQEEQGDYYGERGG